MTMDEDKKTIKKYFLKFYTIILFASVRMIAEIHAERLQNSEIVSHSVECSSGNDKRGNVRGLREDFIKAQSTTTSFPMSIRRRGPRGGWKGH
jgi:hypothetical protein